MGSIIRWIVGLPIAGILTFLLFVGMKALITGDFKPEKKVEATSFDINPKVEAVSYTHLTLPTKA